MPPVPYCAENRESLILTSATESKIGVLMTLLLIGELVDAPSSSAFENGMLPFTDTPPMPGLLLLLPLPRVPGRNVRNACQSGIPPVCGIAFSVSWETVCAISAVVVSSNGAAASCTSTCCVDCATVN